MPIVNKFSDVVAEYAKAARLGWVIPCFCSENLTTTEAILSAVNEYGEEKGIPDLPVIIAMTVRYDHRSQARFYTHSRDWKTGLKLFTADIKVLTEEGSPYGNIRVMLHLDHIQHDLDSELLASDLSDYSSIMYDASSLPFEENIRKTADYVKKMKGRILIEGACDEIFDATGLAHNAITTPENAKRYCDETGVDLIVANLGTEHRASGKDLKYLSDAAVAVKEAVGPKIVLHGTSSVPNEQVANLYEDGICKVNIWTSLERDSTPALFESMVKAAVENAGPDTVDRLVAEGYLTAKAAHASSAQLSHFTTVYRQDIIFSEMKKLVSSYLHMWYKI
ncbi:MAG: class II fructose-bisphosphate aldolase [Saccharofermentanales bacterium]